MKLNLLVENPIHNNKKEYSATLLYQSTSVPVCLAGEVTLYAGSKCCDQLFFAVIGQHAVAKMKGALANNLNTPRRPN